MEREQVTRFTGHCRGCNQDFIATDSSNCPQCGEALSVAADLATVNLGETLAGGTVEADPAGPPDLSQQLVGSQLSLYTIQEFLGRGGMAWVFRAQHDMLQRPCAIKVLSPDLATAAQQIPWRCFCARLGPLLRWSILTL